MPRSKALDHEQKRLGILKQAAVVFAENGYERATMSQVAISAGVSKALIYHYYDSKETLLFDILHSHLNQILAAVEAADASDHDPEQRLRELIQALLTSYRGADHEHRLQQEAMGALAAPQQRKLTRLQRDIVQCFSQTVLSIRPDLEQGDAKRLMPITLSLFGQLNGFYQWYRPGKGMSRSEYGTLTADMFIGGLKTLSS